MLLRYFRPIRFLLVMRPRRLTLRLPALRAAVEVQRGRLLCELLHRRAAASCLGGGAHSGAQPPKTWQHGIL